MQAYKHRAELVPPACLHESLRLVHLVLQVLEDVIGVIAEQLGTEVSEVKPDSKFVDLGADSLDTVEIMMALEEKFELQLDEEGAEKISTVQVICMYLERLQPVIFRSALS